MAIQFTGGTTIYTQIAADNKVLLINNLKTQLIVAGWTLDETLYSEVFLTFTGLPGNNQTVTFDGQAYRFVNALSAAYDVIIGGDADACALALAAAINDSGGEGVLYGTGTAPHPTVGADVSGPITQVFNLTGGAATFTASEGLNNATLDVTTSKNGGWVLSSAKTPQGNQARVRIFDPQTVFSARIHVRVEAHDDDTKYADFCLDSAAARLFEIVANQYQFFVWILSASAIHSSELQVSVPHIRDGQKAPVVSAVADSGGLFQITTSVAHSLTTGDHVFITNAEGQTAINGNWQVTVIDSTSYTLDGSTFAAGYTASSAVAGAYVRGQIGRLILALGYQVNANDVTQSFRNTLVPTVLNSGRFLTILNQFYNTGIGNALNIQLLGTFGLDGTRVDNWGIIPDLIEPRLALRAVPGSSLWYAAGQLWGAFVVMKGADMDVTKSGFAGHNWINYCHNYSNGSLWLATN